MLSRDDVLRMAREASKQGGYPYIDRIYLWRESHQDAEWLERFAALVASHEREACAKVCEGERHIEGQFVANEFADAIRARAGDQPVVCPPGDDGGGDTVE